MSDGVCRAVGTAEVTERVQLNRRSEDPRVEGQGLAGSAGQVEVGRKSGHRLTVTAGARPRDRTDESLSTASASSTCIRD